MEGKTIALKEFQRAQELGADGIKAERAILRNATISLSQTSVETTLGKVLLIMILLSVLVVISKV